ncbi:hypothetical protein AHF37_06775, partial [Paragonimus kellicotti]
MRAKQTKLENQFDDSARVKSVIFRDVSVYVNGYTTPSASELRELVVSHGGKYRTYYTHSTVTHVIASRLPTSKINKLTDQKLVTADWITESIKAKRLLPWQQFQLYPGHLGGSGQQQLRISRISSTSQNFEQQSAEQDHCAMSGNEDPNESRGDDEVEAGQVEMRPAVHARRVKQVRLDNCLSPAKLSTSSSGRAKSSRSLSLKQLLRGFSSCNNSSAPCTSLSMIIHFSFVFHFYRGTQVVEIESRGDDEVEAGQVEMRPAVHARRVKQVRLDNCLSPAKLSTSSSGRAKSSRSLSLKQLLRGFSSCNNSSAPCTSLSMLGNTSSPDDMHHP